MARIKDASVQAVKEAVDIVEVVSLRTSLRRVSGSHYSGRCPFHEERTPSFSVDPLNKLYHCFGCGVGGDVIKFVQETENVDFVGAIEWLAERFRITLEYEESTPREDEERRRRDRQTKLLEQATGYFERVLWDTEAGAPVRAYLEERGLGEEISREFRLGLSRGAGLVAKARESGFAIEEIRAAGLANARGNDYFPFRLMFPLADARGRIVGFQARKLHDDDPLRGKYVNTPESDLFKKGNVLYGLHLARPAIAKQDRAIVVEGNTDVIALRQAGVEPVVASMGTALTEHQVRELGRLTKRLYLCFDADAAGQEATLRGMQLAVGQGFDVRVVALPKGQDPADAPDTFASRLGNAESYLHYRVRIAIEKTDDRQEAFVRAREILAQAEDSPERQEALRLLADRLALPTQALAGLAPARPSVGAVRGGAARRRDAAASRGRAATRTRPARGSRCQPRAAGRARCADAGALRRAAPPQVQGAPRLRRRRRGRGARSVTRGARRARRAGRDRRANWPRARPSASRAAPSARIAARGPRTCDGAPGTTREGALGARRARVLTRYPRGTDGVHDMGGMHGFGAVITPGSDAVSRADWELRVFAISTLVGIEGLGKGSGRAIREEMEPAEYLRAGYYERWLWSTEQRLLRSGAITEDELDAWVAQFGGRRSAATARGPRRGRARGRRDGRGRSARTRCRPAVRVRGEGARATDASPRAYTLPALRPRRHGRRRSGSRPRRAPGHRPLRGAGGAGLCRGVRLRRPLRAVARG